MTEEPKVMPEGSDANESTEEDPKMVPEAEEDPKASPEVSVEHKSTEEDPKMVAPRITCDEMVVKK